MKFSQSWGEGGREGENGGGGGREGGRERIEIEPTRRLDRKSSVCRHWL